MNRVFASDVRVSCWVLLGTVGLECIGSSVKTCSLLLPLPTSLACLVKFTPEECNTVRLHSVTSAVLLLFITNLLYWVRLLLLTLELVCAGMLSRLRRCKVEGASVERYNNRRRGIVVEHRLECILGVDCATPVLLCNKDSLLRTFVFPLDTVLAAGVTLQGNKPADKGRPVVNDVSFSRSRAIPLEAEDTGNPGAVGILDLDVLHCAEDFPAGGRLFRGILLAGVGLCPNPETLLSALSVRRVEGTLRPDSFVLPDLCNLTPLLNDVLLWLSDVMPLIQWASEVVTTQNHDEGS